MTATEEPAGAPEELLNVCLNYPVESGDTLSHGTATYLERRGLIVRDSAGRWIPTGKGIHELSARRKRRK